MMTYIKKILMQSCLVLLFMGSFYAPSSIFAATGTSIQSMDQVTQSILNKHTSFPSAIQRAQKVLSTTTITSATNTEKLAYNNAIKWKNNIKPEMTKTVTYLLNYNSTFQQKYQQLTANLNSNNKNNMLTILKQMQSDIGNGQTQVVNFIQIFRGFRDDVFTNVRNMQSAVDQVESVKSGYQKTIDALAQAGSSQSEMIAIGLKLQDIEPLRGHLQLFLRDFKGAPSTSWMPSPGWLDPINNIETAWNTLDVKLRNVIRDVESSSENVDTVFIKEELQTVKDSWENTYKYAQTLK
ncbi:HBL/NHE enterotoxin family protein [Bacillus toyonensis]|uniref:HBL/NHE enterotoxin family protein n=1 Tax=Bacillus toyonensis TaxID=155322 RepID=UPI000BF3F42B|nr:HBL/NHE enterotoxin family protein [Bacillus toyonensis]PGC84457.1 hypothetical protein COM39_25650 [Bacillus toyonensis]